MKQLFELFISFARIGAFTFGGGYAMLPMIEKEIVEKKKWATSDEILDYYAIGQCTPGLIAVNTATFIGYKRKGILGAIIATLGVVFPSLIIITVISMFFEHFQDYTIVQHALGGVRVAVAALIVHTITKMWKQSIKDWLGILLFIFSFIAVAFSDISPVIIIILGGIIGTNKNMRKKADAK
ncbi:MAG: chromate transporter [Epulopiscium sp.]|jgi:chromate transporter|nr:chromate transporter [Candidatus Epulonipiscium sp.]